MKFECPNCKKSGQVDDSKVPEGGVYATCPQCNNRFLVKRETPKDKPNTKPSNVLVAKVVEKRNKRAVIATLIVFIIMVSLSFLFRYDEEYILGPLYRYDRFTSTVEINRNKTWVAIPRFKNLQQVRDMRAQSEAEDRNEEIKQKIEDQQREAEDRNDELKRQAEDQNAEIKRQSEDQQSEAEDRNEELKQQIEDQKHHRGY